MRDDLIHLHELLFKKDEKSEMEHKVLDWLIDIDRMEDCLNAFRKGRRIFTRKGDLKELRKYFEECVKTTTVLIGN